ncbi:MAG: cation transport ATPase, partial [Crocinitomicaceae bacterium]
MVHTYKISGMSCDSCKGHVHEALSNVSGVTNVVVDLEGSEAQITMDKHVSIDALKTALQETTYDIHLEHETIPTKPKITPTGSTSGTYYCPMHCEGEKTYNAPGNCPVCGMDLIAEVSTESTEDASYRKLIKKFWIAVIFTVPIFAIAMLDMLHENPLELLMEKYYWNWLQLILSIPVVFYATWMFFQRAYASVRRMQLNMFTLIGLGAGSAWIFSLVGISFPTVFPDQFKSSDGSVHLYFEAATVILTLVLLGQLLEARAHSKTSSAVKELLKLAPNTAIRIVNGQEEEISIDKINLGDILRVKPGDKIPVDGNVSEGEGTIDESMITGEPIPVDKYAGDTVSSGTINGTTTFLMTAQKVGADTLLSQIIHMVNTASRSRAPIQKLADKISG